MMHDLERRIAATLAAPASVSTPPADLGDRIAKGIVLRQRRRHTQRLTAGGALVGVLILAVTLATTRDEAALPPPPASPSTSPSTTSTKLPSAANTPRMPTAPTPPTELNQLIDRDHAIKFPMRQPDGLFFRAEALGPSGIIVGGTGLDYDPYRTSDNRLWLLGPATSRRIALTQPMSSHAWAYAAGSTIVAWAEDRGERFEMVCVDPTVRAPSTRQVGRSGIATVPHPIHVNGDVALWTDDTGNVWWIRGCNDAPKALKVPKPVLGLAFPEVFFADQTSGRIRAFNITTGQSSDVGDLPVGSNPSTLVFAANSSFAAWISGSTLVALDRRNNQSRQVPLPSPPSRGEANPGRLTIGNRLVAFSIRQQESDREYGFIYDLNSGLHMTTTTQALVSQDKLLWREETDYVVAPVKPA